MSGVLGIGVLQHWLRPQCCLLNLTAVKLACAQTDADTQAHRQPPQTRTDTLGATSGACRHRRVVQQRELSCNARSVWHRSQGDPPPASTRFTLVAAAGPASGTGTHGGDGALYSASALRAFGNGLEVDPPA
eukprot:CAMPEP_0171072436 /NCGR_PEP_ID=MMETSP0766_2-20121228/10858_1 /TAXON_ID=439317 /ORGANISM="Gambierdiscus australes, Strain CAWD 149" /LENGTH=131 /DNA_ID=CAMNT_0011529023 /DNA_START=73 /DNA_END=465 /DNA_ORIENTATION=+